MMDERGGQTARPKGGGPPGGSAFDRHGRVRLQGARRVLATDDAFGQPETQAYAPPSTTTSPPPPPGSPEIVTPRSFPGGRVTLPRLDGSDGASVHLTGAAFRPDAPRGDTTTTSTSAFADYFTEQSLFTGDVAPDDDSPGPPPAVVAAFAELRLGPDSSWEEVVARHRTLVKEFHPDGFADQAQEIRDHAEAEIRKINNAYDTLRRHRRGSD